ncbi:nitroreductase family protein [Tissierella pigra]|uniref:Nitroreductase family protein n=1 Tax=Tissierella pigra TaxID=2607614 RepID=A0A6N7XIZ2_9FIRM|nr:nitroreductase family protein [Tissierella pigra]MBU5425847.1 nitroreductase family protein [Tissierella pigra]MSU01576.1 nitroreductase family protein [Tissierella pigra]
MDVLKAIMTRRSIRRFTGEVITNEQIDTLLRAGFQAPSAHNMQPWHFVVLKNKELLQEVSEFHKYAQMLPNAGCGIVVCGDEEKQPARGFLVEDCAAAIQNILLASHGIGLGAVWCGLYDSSDLVNSMKEVLGLPSNIIPIGMVVVGNKDEEKEPSNNYHDGKIHYDKW